MSDLKYKLLPTLATPLVSGGVLALLDYSMGKAGAMQSLQDGSVLAASSLIGGFLSQILYKAIDYAMPNMDQQYQPVRDYLVDPLIVGWVYDNIYGSTVLSDFGFNINSLRGKYQNYLYAYVSSLAGSMLSDSVLGWLL